MGIFYIHVEDWRSSTWATLFPQVNEALVKPEVVRLQGNIYLEGMHVLKRTKYIGYISKWLLFPCYCLEEESIVLWYLLWELGGTPRGKIQESTGAILRPATSGIFKSQACLYWAPRGSSIIAEFFYPRTDSSGRFLVPGFCSSKLWFSVSTCFSNFGGSALWPQFSDGCITRRVVDFQFVRLFCFLIVTTGLTTSRLPTYHTGNQKSQFFTPSNIHKIFSFPFAFIFLFLSDYLFPRINHD